MALQPQVAKERRKSFVSQSSMRRKSISNKSLRRPSIISQIPQRKRSICQQSPSQKYLKQFMSTAGKNLPTGTLKAKIFTNMVFAGVTLTAKALEYANLPSLTQPSSSNQQ